MKKLLIVLFGITLLTACSRENLPFDLFAQCLTDKGVKMYGSDSCPHCMEQKKRFKGSFDLVTYIECNQDPETCKKEEITGYPTWEFDGKKNPGTKSLSELAELSGCDLRPAS